MHRPLFYGLHGFRVRDAGAGTIDTLRPYAERAGYEWVDIDYGWVGIIRVRPNNRRWARRVAQTVPPGSVLACHSNGAAIAYEAAHHYGLTGLRALVLINPALQADARFPPHAARCVLNLHNRYDRPLKLAVWWSWLMSRVSPLSYPYGGHTWGSAGRGGFAPGFARLTQMDTGAPGSGQVCGHSGVFGRLHHWWPEIMARIPPERRRVPAADARRAARAGPLMSVPDYHRGDAT